ncbi:LysR family transcriptional regulator [Paraburkholderia sp. RCC_158]|uniref:LysR family transcriptional regulator n=1 Tax=Paraburkholderia sp. RCC_158 TaxID=3239220 RepID=UPI003523840A
MDRIDLFRVFARVVECANFTRAADTLGLPRSSVSAAIQELEGRIGARLLHRTTRKVSPTQDGAALYERCLRLIADVEETENLFRHTSVGPSGVLRIDVPSRIGRLIIAPALPKFLVSYPKIDITFSMTDRTIDLVEERVYCVLRVGKPHDSGMIARPIGDLPLINVASPLYLSHHGTPCTPDDMTTHQVVQYASPSTGRIAPWEWLDGETIRTLTTQGRVTVKEGLQKSFSARRSFAFFAARPLIQFRRRRSPRIAACPQLCRRNVWQHRSDFRIFARLRAPSTSCSKQTMW